MLKRTYSLYKCLLDKQPKMVIIIYKYTYMHTLKHTSFIFLLTNYYYNDKVLRSSTEC